MVNNIITTEHENYPLLLLPEGETSVIIPVSHELIPRTFKIYCSKNTFRVIESENDKIHQISKEVVEELSMLGFEDDEICELFVYIHECLQERDIINSHDEISKVIKEIYEKEISPISLFRKFKQMTLNEVVSVMVSKNPYRTYYNITSSYEEDEYSDGNHER